MKKTSLSAIALLSAALYLGTAHAQTTTDSMNNGTPDNSAVTDTTTVTTTTVTTTTDFINGNIVMTGMMDASLTTSDADRQYLMESAQGSVYDQATAELAVQKAQSKTVQRYATRLMDDHNRLNKKLLMQANKRGMILPLTMSSDDQSNLQILMNARAGQDFDVAYLQEAIRINADDVRKANDAMNASSDKDFRSLMKDYAATEQNHLDAASKTLAELRKNSPALNNNLMNGTTANGTAANGTTANGTTPNTTPPNTTN